MEGFVHIMSAKEAVLGVLPVIYFFKDLGIYEGSQSQIE